jgi:hypothetical protein
MPRASVGQPFEADVRLESLTYLNAPRETRLSLKRAMVPSGRRCGSGARVPEASDPV